MILLDVKEAITCNLIISSELEMAIVFYEDQHISGYHLHYIKFYYFYFYYYYYCLMIPSDMKITIMFNVG